MNHIEFIEVQVKAELMRQGFSQTIAQGGHGRQWIYTNVCHRQHEKGGGFSKMLCATRSYGQKRTRYRRNENRRSAGVTNPCRDFFEG